MEYSWIYIPIMLGIVFLVALILKMKEKGNTKASNENHTKASVPTTSITTESMKGIKGITIQQLPLTERFNERGLTEIKDRQVIARINSVFPAATQTVLNDAAKNTVTKILQDPMLFKVKIPANTELVKATKAGKQYATFRGSKKGMALLEKPDANRALKPVNVANGVASIMNIGSMVVGQYYMSQISAKLESMNKSIVKISDFQNREFLSQILSLIALVDELSQFSSDFIESDEQCNQKLAALESYRAKATELLLHTNIAISEIIKNTPHPDLSEYKSKTSELNQWITYQEVLVALLAEIGKLTYLFGKGTISNEASYHLYNKFVEQSKQTRVQLAQWHNQQMKSLKIDLDKMRVSKAGFDAVFAAIPSIIDPKFKYKGLEESFVQGINTQAQPLHVRLDKVDRVYDEDVEVVIKDGKYYYVSGSDDIE